MEMRACARACMCDQIEKKNEVENAVNNAIVVNKLFCFRLYNLKKFKCVLSFLWPGSGVIKLEYP